MKDLLLYIILFFSDATGSGALHAQCEANFEWFNGNENLQIQFHDLSDDDPDIVSWHWNFGDGHMSEQQNPLHTYAGPGVYMVCLVVVNELGCVSDVCHDVQVLNQNGDCEAAFEWEAEGLEVHFFDNSDDDPDIVTWLWTFGDGQVSDDPNPVHIYDEPGVYVVCLTVINEFNCTGNICHEVHVNGGPGECDAEFEWYNGNDNLQIQFQDLSDADPDIVSWYWEFGDGHTTTQQHPLHTYAAPGTYLVCLVIENEFGCVADVCHEVAVLDQNGDCEAAFEWEAEWLEVHFFDNSDDDPDIVSWSWSFGDGQTSDEANPVHTYAESGYYTVCLLVINEFGCASDICHGVYVTEGTGPCEAAFEWEGTGLDIQFIDHSYPGPAIISWHWNFGDGHTSDEAYPVHTYAEPGVYVVCLVVVSEFGCASDICHEVHVGDVTGCEAAYEWFNGNQNQSIQFHDLSDDDPDIVSWHWEFGDGHTSQDQHPLHIYNEPGVYVVCLVVENEFGCVSDICHEVHVGGGTGSCEADFVWEGSGLVIHFLDQSDNDPDIVSWMWNFGDGHFSDDANPVHTYAEPGVYVVCLLVVNELGCASDICHEVHVGEGEGTCEAAFEWFNGNENQSVHFHDLSDDDPDIVSWHWNFGDGHVSEQQHPLHIYDQPGLYLVCLVVVNELGCVSDVCHEVSIPQGIMIALELNPPSITGPRNASLQGPITTRETETLDIEVFPNPADSYINIQFELGQATEGSIYLHDLHGKTIFETTDQLFDAGKNTISYNMSEYYPGMYFISLKTEEGMWTKKVLKVD